MEGPRIVLAVARFQSLNHSLQAAPGLLKNTSSGLPFADRCSHNNPPTSKIVSRISKRILLLFNVDDLDLAQAPWAFAKDDPDTLGAVSWVLIFWCALLGAGIQ